MKTNLSIDFSEFFERLGNAIIVFTIVCFFFLLLTEIFRVDLYLVLVPPTLFLAMMFSVVFGGERKTQRIFVFMMSFFVLVIIDIIIIYFNLPNIGIAMFMALGVSFFIFIAEQ